MICIHPVSAFTLFLYVYIWIPLYQTSRAVFGFFSFLLDPHRQPEAARFEENPGSWELDLPTSRFQDLELRSEKEEEMCSICLMEFEKDDMVNKLPKCGHMFHTGCMEKWLDRCQFTCPLCRCLVLRPRSTAAAPCKSGAASPFCINLAPENEDNYLATPDLLVYGIFGL